MWRPPRAPLTYFLGGLTMISVIAFRFSGTVGLLGVGVVTFACLFSVVGLGFVASSIGNAGGKVSNQGWNGVGAVDAGPEAPSQLGRFVVGLELAGGAVDAVFLNDRFGILRNRVELGFLLAKPLMVVKKFRSKKIRMEEV